MNKVYQRINWQNEPSIATPLNETNLNKIDYALDVVDGRVVTFDTTKANQSDLLQTVKTVAYNTTTGVFTFTFWNGNTVTADLNIEKIPVDFSMDEYGVITMTTADGTTYTCDISELIKLYTFSDSSEIDFTTTTDQSGNKTITASIVSGSITGDKLQPNYLADCVSAKNDAETAETNAGQSARNSELSSEDSEAWAVGERNGQPVPSTDPAYQNNAKWWAQHGTGSSFAGLSDTNFTNLQNGQIAKYDSTTQMWVNTEDEGGLLPHFKITSEAGSTVTVVCPDTSVITPTQTSSGIWQCDVPAYGVYTVHAVINGDDAVRTVTVDTVKEYVIHDEHYSYTLNVYAPTGSSILVTDNGSETYTGTGAGSTAVIFALYQASTLYHITVTYDGLDIDTTITSSATSGGSGSKTITFGTINLTVDEDLIGETIIMAKGTDTVSKVASSTSMVFYPNATGNWRISVDYEGETVYAEPDPIVVSSLSTPVSAELSLVKIPEGATVLPTDDIQTWLKCANITDKSYTTLAEVLADRETFETLIADSNACDYMARSTTWAVAEGAVPTMTDNTHPSGECIGQNYVNNGYYLSFNGSTSTSDNAGAVTGQVNGFAVGYHFDEPIRLYRARYWNRETAPTYGVADHKYQGSNDGINWIDLTDTLTMSNPNSTTPCDEIINSETAYSYIRLYVINAWDNASTTNKQTTYCNASELQFYEADITHSQDAMALIGKYDYCSNALLSNPTWAEAIVNSDYWDSVCNVSVPKMTSDTAPSGQVLYSTQYNATYAAYKVFDKDLSTNWAAAASDSYGTMRVGYRFTEPRVIKVVSIDCSAIASPIRIVGFRIVAKDASETEWTTLLTVTDRNTNAKEYYYLNNSNAYTDYNIIIDSAPGSPIDNSRISELQFYGRASSNVSNTNGIIHTAMGNESVYCVETGDTFTATDGIATVDFSQFDEGVYTFGSTTAKNPSDLSQDYTKQFHITKSPYGGTTELYLMPDAVKTLYWWGYMSDDCEELSTANGWTYKSGWPWKSPTYNTNDIILNAGGSGQYYYTGIAAKHKLPLGTTVKAVGMGLSIASTIAMSLLNWNNGKAVSSDGNPVDYSSWNTINTDELKSFISTHEDYAEVVSWVGGRSGKLHAFWYE